MRKSYEYLINIVREIDDLTIFPHAEEKYEIELKIQEGRKQYITILKNELEEFLFGNMKNQRVDLTVEQIKQIETELEKSMLNAERRFGPFD